jgi:FAD dependent oxidoreductase
MERNESIMTESLSVTENVPILDGYDVVVCGAGSAGLGAAVAAARAGARTLLVEQLGHLGGMATSANIGCFCDSPAGPVYAELIERLQSLDAGHWVPKPPRYHAPGRMPYHGETLKLVAMDMVHGAGADVMLTTVVDSPYMLDSAVAGVFVANKGGRALVKANVVIDATADADVAAGAGAEVMKGDPDDGRLQHVNFRFTLDNVDIELFKRDGPARDELIAMLQEAHKDGRIRVPANIFRPHPKTFPWDTLSEELSTGYFEIEHVDASDPIAVNRTLCECHLATLDIIRFCRENLPGYEKCRVNPIQSILGTRESRRIMGGYVLAGADVINAHKFDDGIARASFWIDHHDSPPGITMPHTIEHIVSTRPAEGDWYEIPYRCLVPKGVRGLLVAGRCISCDRDAQASMRIMPTCMYTGTAAGIAAAMAGNMGVRPDELDGREVRRQIENMG